MKLDLLLSKQGFQVIKTNDDWWTPKPLTEEQMKQEIAFSQVKDKPIEEFPPEAITKTLKTLNLNETYGRPDEYRDGK